MHLQIITQARWENRRRNKQRLRGTGKSGVILLISVDAHPSFVLQDTVHGTSSTDMFSGSKQPIKLWLYTQLRERKKAVSHL